MAFRYLIAIALVATVVSGAPSNTPSNSLPGAQIANNIAAATLDGAGRYLSRGGPIVPAIIAAGTAPSRVAETVSNGLDNISSRLDRQAQSLSQNGQPRMPGLDMAESAMPQSIASLGQNAMNLIHQKNSWIQRQAEQGVAAAGRLGQMMSVRASQNLPDPSKMLGSAQEFLSKGASTLEKQTSQHLNGAMERMNSMQGMGRQVGEQVQGLAKTISNGLGGALGQLQQTGQEAISQIQRNHQTNMNSLSGVIGSLQGTMGQARSNVQSNMSGAMQQAQSTVQQLTSGLQRIAQAPMKTLASLQESIGGMMKSGVPSSSGRY